MMDRDQRSKAPTIHLESAGISSRQILAARGPKNEVDPNRPYHAFVEPEFSVDRIVEDVATIFLTNRECPFRCLMCDLWRNTTDKRVAAGAIAEQIQHALATLPDAARIKLYNSGNFFDAAAIPSGDLPQIAKLVCGFQSVIVENHPKLCGDRCLYFRDLCGKPLEIAMGLETSHDATLRRLNKQMCAADFAHATKFLVAHGIRVRAFILLRPPWTSEQEGVQRAIDSVRFAFDSGVDCCAIIPTRAGNGIMDHLAARGDFVPPQLTSLETVVDQALAWNRGIVLADLWDVQRFATCHHCADRRIQRLQSMNLTQTVPPSVVCLHCVPEGSVPQ